MILYVANRGEIARRVIKTAQRMGFKTAVGFARQDEDMPFVQEADLRISLEGEEALETYLNAEKVISAAKKLDATHLHPGYGFLSENADFVERVTKAGIEFVGPPARAMRLLGDKVGARKFLLKHHIPLLPSYNGDTQEEGALLEEAQKLGFPLLIKPSAGGGGKGMYKVYRSEDFVEALRSSKRVAASSFKDDRVFLEKLVEPARHIEVQILGDKSGIVRAFGERECSLQRRHQKVFEEAPCEFLTPQVRKRLHEDSERIAREANYSSAGTVEWIWDGGEGMYFLEVNARLQVEHPVTEMIFGVDLVEWQLRISQGETLKNLAPLSPKGHSIEARLCSEEPAQDFLPSGGKILRQAFPQSIRVDAGFYEKNSVPPQFDSLMAKVIAFAPTRSEAISRLRRALEETLVFGPKTNRAYLIQVLKDARVTAGELSTSLLSEIKPEFDVFQGVSLIQTLQEGMTNSESLEDSLDWHSPWGALPRPTRGLYFEDHGALRFFHTAFADWSEKSPLRRQTSQEDGPSASSMNESSLKSPMPAKVIKVLVSKGEKVKKGQVMVVLEAMKMEHQLKAPRELVIHAVHVKESDRVAYDALLMEWEVSE